MTTGRKRHVQSASGIPGWRWRTFPVFFAFVSGMLVAFLSNGGTVNPLAFVLLIAALAGFFYGVVHMFVVNVVLARRVRRRAQADARGEDLPEDFETELVYPGEE
ncbi:MAG: hypothetical protein HYX50_01360 [Chloroflexi bacterium]|nr:hypothetical protein [Chloroflexota bacterium]